ncbi:MAG: protein jag [Oscillospiraceae bacterium]|nr:protein jag [Oscillospiraceae bacterium]
MTKYIEVSGKTREDAVNAGLAQLGLSRDDVSVEILEQEKRGFLGLGSAPAKVRLTYEAPDEPAPKPEPPVQPKPSAQPNAAPAPEAPQEAPVPAPKAAAPAGSQQERVEKYLHGLLDLMGIRADIKVSERDNGGLNVELSGSGMGAVIGRRGETLDAIQHLVNYSVNRGSEKRLHISVDAENYRSKREDSLVRLAEKMAAKAVKYRRSMALEPMNSYERHVIHTALQDYPGVSTASVGVEPNRRVVVNFEKQEAPKAQSREWA